MDPFFALHSSIQAKHNPELIAKLIAERMAYMVSII